VSNATCYDCFTARVEVAHQAGVCYYTPDLLTVKATELSLVDFDTLTKPEQKRIIELVKQDYLTYLLLHNINAKMHSQLNKDVANDYSKGNSEAYPANIHQALTLMNEYKPFKLDAVAVPAKGTAFVTKIYGKGKKGGSKKYYNNAEWKALSYEAQVKIINEQKKAMGDDGSNDKSVASAKSAKSIKSITKTMKLLEKDTHRLKKSVSTLQKCNEGEDNDLSISSAKGSSHFQEAMEMLQESHPKISLALKSSKSIGLDIRNVLLLDNQSTFDLRCNRKFVNLVRKAMHALNMMSNCGGLKITEQCKIPGYKFWVWFSEKAITNIIFICLKNLIKIYRVTYDSEVDTTFVVLS
jgi:hypothetical protein